MNNRQFAVIVVLLLIIIALLVHLNAQNNETYAQLIHGINYLSDKIDVLTSLVKG